LSAAESRRATIEGPAGVIEIAYAIPADPVAIAVVAHPHPLFGGAMENKVVTTLAKAFTDAGADTWTATVNYGDGSGAKPLTLNADKTFGLSHVYADNDVYTVTVTVSRDAMPMDARTMRRVGVSCDFMIELLS